MELQQESDPGSVRAAAPPLFHLPRHRDPLLRLAALAFLVILAACLDDRVDLREPFNPVVAAAALGEVVLWAAVAWGLVLVLALLRDARRGTLGARLRRWADSLGGRLARTPYFGVWLRRARARRLRRSSPGAAPRPSRPRPRRPRRADARWQPPHWSSARPRPARSRPDDRTASRPPTPPALSPDRGGGTTPAEPAPVPDGSTSPHAGQPTPPQPVPGPPELSVRLDSARTVAGLPVTVRWESVGADHVVVDGRPHRLPPSGRCDVTVDATRAITVAAVGPHGRTVVTTQPVDVLPVALFQPVPPGHPGVQLTADVELPRHGVDTVLRRLDAVYARQGRLRGPLPPRPPAAPRHLRGLPPYDVATRGGSGPGAPPADAPVRGTAPVDGPGGPVVLPWSSRAARPRSGPARPDRPSPVPRATPAEPSAARLPGDQTAP